MHAPAEARERGAKRAVRRDLDLGACRLEAAAQVRLEPHRPPS